MNRPTTIRVAIYGTDLTFRTDDPEYIRELAAFVEEQIQKAAKSAKGTSSTKALTLAAFNISDELFRLRREKQESGEHLSKRLDALLQMAEEPYQKPQTPAQT
ncbi:MAG: cell division protein ZapA [Candidatus Abyssobacteria bacterium SURF_17]|uniref:Cell division protein ZapA n=1 Tax=Candidatus Abyssobacteria bacterium SURF_17 TaxID=2093361 RepID=A0A419ETL9_9BACT|nr:MAG: cell division protein ZapA [Candidatus Abyssubacteria bacterium SURF_17]